MEYTSDYSSLLSSGLGAGVGAVLGGFLVLFIIIGLAVTIFSLITMWKIFEKANKPGWAAIVPIYNVYVLYEITWGNGLYFLLLFLGIIPVLGSIAVFVIFIITNIKLSKSFGQSGGFAVGLIFLPLIFMAILAFGKNYNYVGVENETKTILPEQQ